MKFNTVELMDGLWTFPLEVTGSLLPSVNCFVVKGTNGGKNLLIDTGCDPSQISDWCDRVKIDSGFLASSDTPTLLEIMQAMSLTPENTDVFLTHLHTDHSGNAVLLSKLGYHIIMSKTAFEKEVNKYPFDKKRMLSEGINRITPEMELLAYVISGNSCTVDADLVEDGDVLHYGKFAFECVSTPGHSQGHMCLYDCNSKALLLGDQVMFDANTSVMASFGVKDPLKDYLESLDRLSQYEVARAFSSHGLVEGKLNCRISEIQNTIYERLNYLCCEIRKHPGLGGFTLAKKMSIPYNKKPWREISLVQTYFTVGKTFACLDYLVNQGSVIRKTENGLRKYYPADIKD